MCPVTSYVTYIQHLSPKSESLWQTPKFEQFPNEAEATKKFIWYYGTLGHNKLESFVSDIAYACGIERGTYTNHSLRHTAINTLKKTGHSDKQVMAMSGHKSASSLNTYQHVDDQEKTKMGLTLAKTLTTQETNPIILQQQVEKDYINLTTGVKWANQQLAASKGKTAITEPRDPTPQKQQRVETPETPELNDKELTNIQHQTDGNMQKNLIVAIPEISDIPKENISVDPQFEISDQDILTALADCEQNEQLMLTQHVSTTTSTSTKQMVLKKSSPRVPMFSNCQISGNITINFNKN